MAADISVRPKTDAVLTLKPVIEPGRFAGRIAPPKAGIDNKPGDFECVKIEGA